MLLDTHVLLWLYDDAAALGPRTRGLLASAAAVTVSTASLWEIAIKKAANKLSVAEDFVEGVTASGVTWLPITAEHVWAVSSLHGLAHRDPLDRLLVAVSRVEGLPFVTADRAILSSAVTPSVRFVDART